MALIWISSEEKGRKNEKVNTNYFRVVSCIIINFHSKALMRQIRKHQASYHTPDL